MSGTPDSEVQAVMGLRLRAVRDALGLTQQAMADNMGVVVTTLSAWESGRNQIDIVKLAKSATRWGFTTDWVARGDMSGLRKDLADKIDALTTKTRPSRKGRPAASDPSPKALPSPKGLDPPRPIAGGNVNKSQLKVIGSGRSAV